MTDPAATAAPTATASRTMVVRGAEADPPKWKAVAKALATETAEAFARGDIRF